MTGTLEFGGKINEEGLERLKWAFADVKWSIAKVLEEAIADKRTCEVSAAGSVDIPPFLHATLEELRLSYLWKVPGRPVLKGYPGRSTHPAPIRRTVYVTADGAVLLDVERFLEIVDHPDVSRFPREDVLKHYRRALTLPALQLVV